MIDYLDGNLSDAERMDVELFLQENPEIAEQISDWSDVVLMSNEEIIYDRKEELLTVALSNQEFEQWENMQPKLLKEHISYPDKHKLFKFEKRRMPQWTWYAAAACIALAITFTIYDLRFTNENVLDELPIAILPIEEMESGKWKIENEVVSTEFISSEVERLNDRVEVAERSRSHSSPEPLIAQTIFDDEQLTKDNEIMPNDNDEMNFQFSIFNFQLVAISTIPLSTEKVTLSPKTDLLIEPRFEEELEFEPTEFRLIERVAGNERLLAAADQFIVTPAKTIIHNVVRRFYVRKTEVELFLEEVEMPRFFAQR